MITCMECGKKLGQLNNHLKIHNLTAAKYKEKYPGFVIQLFSQETKEIISEKLRGHKRSKKSREKQSKTMIGHKHSEETKQKISSGNIGRFFSAKTRKKMSEKAARNGNKNGMFGKSVNDIWNEKYDEETVEILKNDRKEKISKAQSGENNWIFGLTKETDSRVAKISENLKRGYMNGSRVVSPKAGIGIGGYYKDTGIWMRSSYELRRAAYLDSIGTIWAYEEKVYDLGDTSWRPDFHIYDQEGNLIRIEEVKGYCTERFKKIFPKFCKLYPGLLKITKILFVNDLDTVESLRKK